MDRRRKFFVLALTCLLFGLTGNITVGAEPNLVSNPGFEEGSGKIPDSWVVGLWWDTKDPQLPGWKADQVFEWANDPKTAHSGNKCARLIDIGWPPAVHLDTKEKIPVENDPRVVYELSAYARGGAVSLQLYCYDSAGKDLGRVQSPKHILKDVWSKETEEFIVGDLPAGTRYVQPTFQFSSSNYKDVYLDNISFIKSNRTAFPNSEVYEFGNGDLKFSFRGLSLESLFHKKIAYFQKATPLFSVNINGITVSSDNFRILEKKQDKDKLTILSKYHALSIKAKFELELKDSKSYWLLSLENNSPETVTVNLHFPSLQNIRIGESWEDDVVMLPLRLGAIRRAPLLSTKPWPRGAPFQAMPYLGMMSMQVIDLSDSSLKGGVCLIIEDDTLPPLDKSFNIIPQDKDKAVTFLVSYDELKISPGETFTTPKNLFYFHPGGWEEACDTYRDWFYSKFGRMPERPKWVKEAIGHARIMWIEKAPEIVKEIPFYKNYIIRLNSVWGSLAGPEGAAKTVQDAIAELHRMGVKSTVYYEGWVVGANSDVWREHGPEWVMRNKSGNMVSTPYGREQYAMCPGATGWQDYLSHDVTEMRLDWGFNGIYIDSLGCQAGYRCYNLNHGHKSPRTWNEGCFELFTKTNKRIKTLNPDGVLEAEGVGSDFLALTIDNAYATNFCPAWLFREPGTFDVTERITNVLKYTFPEIITTAVIGGWGDPGGPWDGNFAETLLCNQIAHINGQIPAENINTPTIEKLTKLRLENLDTLNYGLLDKYLRVSGAQKLIYNGFKGEKRYLVALINSSSSPSSFKVIVPQAALPDSLKGRVKIEDRWGSKIKWNKKGGDIIIEGEIGPYPWEKLNNSFGTGWFSVVESRFKDFRLKDEKVQSLEALDNIRIIVMSKE